MAMAQNMLVSVLFLLLASGDGAMVPQSGKAEGAIQSAAVPQEEVQVQAAFTAANQTEAGTFFYLPKHSTSAISMALNFWAVGLKCGKWNRLGKIEGSAEEYGKVLQLCKQRCLDDGECKAISGSRLNYGGKSWCILCKKHLWQKHVGWNQKAQHTDAFKKAVWTCGGNAHGQQCLENFEYNGVKYAGCAGVDNGGKLWCYTDKYGSWGNCHLPQAPYKQRCKDPAHFTGSFKDDMVVNTCGPGSFAPCQSQRLSGKGANVASHKGCPPPKLSKSERVRKCATIDGSYAYCADNDEYCDYMELRSASLSALGFDIS